MAVRTSNSATESTVKDFKFWTGVIPYRVVAVNPTLAELNKFGVEYLQNEPEYISRQDFGKGEVVNSIVDFWVQSVKNPDLPEDLDILTNIRFRINHEEWEGSKTGKVKYINKYGRVSGWKAEGEDLSGDKYWLNEGARVMRKGEEELHKFLFAWLNMTYDTKNKSFDECLLDINKLIKGDFSELKEVVNSAKEYIVKIPTGVQSNEKDGKIRYYQVLYNQMFLKHNQHSTNRLEEYMNKDEYTSFGTPDRPVYFTFDVQEFDKSVKPDKDPEPVTKIAESVF